jgi:hypothetical protein
MSPRRITTTPGIRSFKSKKDAHLESFVSSFSACSGTSCRFLGNGSLCRFVSFQGLRLDQGHRLASRASARSRVTFRFSLVGSIQGLVSFPGIRLAQALRFTSISSAPISRCVSDLIPRLDLLLRSQSSFRLDLVHRFVSSWSARSCSTFPFLDNDSLFVNDSHQPFRLDPR